MTLPPHATADEIANLMTANRVAYASGTPSFWRRLVLFADPSALHHVPLKQITLGGEVVDQQVLDLLHTQFPQTRLVHIYATTELGRCFSVTDAQAGFPKHFLDETSPDGVAMKIDTGELYVRSANAMSRYDPHGSQPQIKGDWFPTGDLVRVENHRVYFVGRKSDIINVGGHKVHPLQIENEVRSVPGVLDARVYAKRSSIAGELVACQIVVESAYDPAKVQDSVQQHCHEALTSFQRPRFIELVQKISSSAAGKIVRKDNE